MYPKGCAKAFVVCICMCCIFMLSTLSSRSVVSPLRKLAENMQEVAKGSYKIKVQQESYDEIGYIINTFADMTQKIECLINENLKGKITAATPVKSGGIAAIIT